MIIIQQVVENLKLKNDKNKYPLSLKPQPDAESGKKYHEVDGCSHDVSEEYRYKDGVLE